MNRSGEDTLGNCTESPSLWKGNRQKIQKGLDTIFALLLSFPFDAESTERRESEKIELAEIDCIQCGDPVSAAKRKIDLELAGAKDEAM